jgi:hypothetical protein
MPSAGGPTLLYFQELPETYKGGKSEYDDGNVEAAVQHGGVGTKRWVYRTDGLTAAQAAPLISHYNASKFLADEGISAETFTLADRDSGLSYTGVRYAKFEHSHTKTWSHSFEIEFVRFP